MMKTIIAITFFICSISTFGQVDEFEIFDSAEEHSSWLSDSLACSDDRYYLTLKYKDSLLGLPLETVMRELGFANISVGEFKKEISYDIVNYCEENNPIYPGMKLRLELVNDTISKATISIY